MKYWIINTRELRILTLGILWLFILTAFVGCEVSTAHAMWPFTSKQKQETKEVIEAQSRQQSAMKGNITQPQPNIFTNTGSGSIYNIAPIPQLGTFSGQLNQRTESEITVERNEVTRWKNYTVAATLLAAALLIVTVIVFFKMTAAGRAADALAGTLASAADQRLAKWIATIDARADVVADPSAKQTLTALSGEAEEVRGQLAATLKK